MKTTDPCALSEGLRNVLQTAGNAQKFYGSSQPGLAQIQQNIPIPILDLIF